MQDFSRSGGGGGSKVHNCSIIYIPVVKNSGGETMCSPEKFDSLRRWKVRYSKVSI